MGVFDFEGLEHLVINLRPSFPNAKVDVARFHGANHSSFANHNFYYNDYFNPNYCFSYCCIQNLKNQKTSAIQGSLQDFSR